MNEIYRIRNYGPLRGFEKKDEAIDAADKALKFAEEQLKKTEEMIKQYESGKKDNSS